MTGGLYSLLSPSDWGIVGHAPAIFCPFWWLQIQTNPSSYDEEDEDEDDDGQWYLYTYY